MIISASYRTDIPAFYGAWFENRLRAGECQVANPYGGPDYRVSLRPADIDGLVFWTRNIGPFGGALSWARRHQLPFVVQYTITGYPRVLEAAVPDVGDAIGRYRDLARAFGIKSVVWRYDPLIFTSLTPAAWHVDNFARIASRLAGCCDTVILSFVHVYRKTRRNLDAAAARHGFSWRRKGAGERAALLARLAAVAGDHGIAASLCAQPDDLIAGVGPARCIDAARLSMVADRPIKARRKGNRPGCLCDRSRDIGAYDSCPHGCCYCYANGSRRAAAGFRKGHDSGAATLEGVGR